MNHQKYRAKGDVDTSLLVSLSQRLRQPTPVFPWLQMRDGEKIRRHVPKVDSESGVEGLSPSEHRVRRTDDRTSSMTTTRLEEHFFSRLIYVGKHTAPSVCFQSQDDVVCNCAPQKSACCCHHHRVPRRPE